MAGELVLVIEDQAEMREWIVNRVLSPHGYRFTVANDQAELRPDLIIVDTDMAELADLQAIELLPDQEHRIPVIALGSAPTVPLSFQGSEFAINEYLHKPLDAESLLQVIEHLLAESRNRKRPNSWQGQVQRLLQQQKMLYTIAQTMTALSEEQQALNRLVEAAVYAADADEASLFIYEVESGSVYIRALIRKGQRVRATNLLVQDALVLRTVESGEPLILSGPDAVAAQSSVPALLQFPLKFQGRVLGVLRLSCLSQDCNFGQDSIYILSLLASYASLVVNNTRLQARIERELAQTDVYRIGVALGSTLKLEAVVEMVLSEAIRLTDAERGYVALLDEKSGLYMPYAMHALDKQAIESAQFRLGRYVVRRVLERSEPVHTATEDQELINAGLQSQALICVPMLGSSGVIGAIYVDRLDHERRFMSRQFDLLTILAVHAAAAIENARLFSQMEAERRKLEAVIRGTDQPVIVTDVEGVVLLMNSAARQVLGTPRPMGTGLLLPHVIENANLRKLFQEVRASGQVQRGEVPLQNDRTFSATITPISGVGFVAILQDITQFKELARLKSEFVATVSHDLRSPLSTVISFLEVLEQLGPLNEQQKDFVQSAQDEAHRLIDLTSELLDLGCLESGIDMEMKQCDLKGLAVAALQHWQKAAQECQHVLEIDLPPEPVFVYGNAMRLRQVLDNLLNNAIKYTPEGGQVAMSLNQEGTRVFLRVRDSGIGIAPEDQPHIFERFYRVHSDQTRDIQGTGLGLTIVQSIVERHNGRIWVESELGQGSMFVVVLPTAA